MTRKIRQEIDEGIAGASSLLILVHTSRRCFAEYLAPGTRASSPHETDRGAVDAQLQEEEDSHIGANEPYAASARTDKHCRTPTPRAPMSR